MELANSDTAKDVRKRGLSGNHGFAIVSSWMDLEYL